MNRRFTIPALAVSLALGAAALAATAPALRLAPRPTSRAPASVAPATQPAAGPAEPWDTYRVLAQRNIFVRDRSRLAAGSRGRGGYNSRPAYSSSSGSADQAMILTGVGQGDEEGQAFVEDPVTGTTFRTWAGQPLAGGQVNAVTLDGIEYELKGMTRQIKVGQDLTGATPASLAPPPAAAVADGPPAGPGGGPLSAGPAGTGVTGQPVAFGGPGATTMPAGPGAGPGATMISLGGRPGTAATQPAMSGGPPIGPGPGRGPAAAPAQPAAGGSADDAAARAILERMRQRRLQETR